MNKDPSPKLFQSWVITPCADRPFVSDPHHIGEACPGDFFMHKFLYHQRFPKRFAGENSEFAALVEWVPGCDRAIIRLWRRVDFNLFDVAARSKMAEY